MSGILRRGLTAAAFSALTILGGCQSHSTGRVLPVSLPPPPECLGPVALPPVKAGDDARLALARHRAALVAANGNLNCGRQWYGALRSGFAAAKPMTD